MNTAAKLEGKSRDEVTTLVRDAVAEVLLKEPQEITLESHFRDDLGADSVDIATLIMVLEDGLGLDIPDDALENVTKVEDIVEYLVEHPAR